MEGLITRIYIKLYTNLSIYKHHHYPNLLQSVLASKSCINISWRRHDPHPKIDGP